MRLLKALPACLFALAFALIAPAPASADSNCSGYNSNVAALTLTAHAAGTVHSPDIVNCRTRGGIFIVDMTVATHTSMVVTIEGKDAASGKYYTLLQSAALTSVATTQLTVYPGFTAAGNVSANSPIPQVFRVTAVISDSGGTAATTATIGASVLN